MPGASDTAALGSVRNAGWIRSSQQPHLGRSRRTCGWQTRTPRSRWGPDHAACQAGSAHTTRYGWAWSLYQIRKACCRRRNGRRSGTPGLRGAQRRRLCSDQCEPVAAGAARRQAQPIPALWCITHGLCGLAVATCSPPNTGTRMHISRRLCLPQAHNRPATDAAPPAAQRRTSRVQQAARLLR